MADGCDYQGSSNMSIRTLHKEVRTLAKCYRPDWGYHGFVTSDGAFIIYTFLLLCVPFSPDAAFIY